MINKINKERQRSMNTTKYFYTKFKAMKVFSVNLLQIAYCIFVAEIMTSYISTNVRVWKLKISKIQERKLCPKISEP
jgi:hypothetical protein